MSRRFDRLSAVARAGLVCARRRVLRSRTAAVSVVAVAVALPVVGTLAGRQAGDALGPALSSHRAVALSLAFSIGATAVLLGVIVALLAPRRAFLGSQLEAAPLPPLAVFAVVTCLPVVVAGAVVSAFGLFFLVPALGTQHAPAAVAAGWAGFALGAAATEGAVATREARFAVGALAGAAALWALGAAGAGTGAVLGPFGYLALELTGDPATVGTPVPALVATAVSGLCLWALAAALRRDGPPARRAVRALLPVPPRPALAVFVVALKRHGRRPELRRQSTAIVGLAGGGGILLGAALSVDAEPLVLFSGSLAVLGAAAVPLAAAGLDAEAEWLWRAAPVRRQALAAAATLAALASGVGVAAAATVPVVAWARPSAGALLQLLAVALFCFGAAALAGALVPWRADRPAEQLASLTAFAAVAGGLWLVLSRIATAVPGTPMTAALLAVETALAVAVSAVLAGRSSPC